MKTKKSAQKPRTILDDHERKGKKFIPPLRQIPNLSIANWPKDQLPETIWLALMVHRLGWNRATTILDKIVTKAHEVGPKDRNWILLSDYYDLSEEARVQVIGALSQSEREDLEWALAPLSIYDHCPIHFMCSQEESTEQAIAEVRVVCERVFDKKSKESLYAIALSMWVLIKAGRLVFPPDIVIPDLNSFKSYPKTPESREAASFLRAMYGGVVASHAQSGSVWCSAFWDFNRAQTDCI